MKVNERIAEIVAEDCLFEDFTLWAHSADWAQYLDMQNHISILLREEDGIVYAKPVANILGFSGTIEGTELCMPNEHLHTEVMQVLTILEFIPRNDNINDHTPKVFMRWARESREKRDKEIHIIHRKLLEQCGQDGIPSEKLLSVALDNDYTLDTDQIEKSLRALARKIYRKRQET